MPRRDRITLRSRDPRALTPAELDEIWRLTDRYVETERSYLEASLREFREFVLARDAAGVLVGTTAIDAYPFRHEGRTTWVLFTAATVIDEAYRRRGILERIGVRTFLRVKLRNPLRRVCWLFDTFSFKSYLLLPRNFAVFWPRRDRPTPEPVRAFVDALATARYGDAWDRQRGIVRRSGRKRLRPRTAPVDEELLADPDVSFFESANPGHREGDMLVCFCPLGLPNWLRLARSSARRLLPGSRRGEDPAASAERERSP